MKKYYILNFVFYFSVCLVYAQPETRLKAGFDIGGGGKAKSWIVSGQYNEYLTIGRSGLLQVGWGIRGTHFNGKELDFFTAPANLSTGKSGFGAIGAPLLKSQIDTLQLRGSVTSFNFNLGLQISLFNRLDLGINADLLGFAFGTKRSGYYLGSGGFNKTDSLNLHKTNQQARPTSIGVQLLGDNTRGNLHTELYARLHITQRVGLKVSYLFTTNEYITDQVLVDDNRRFRHRSPMIYIGLHFPIGI